MIVYILGLHISRPYLVHRRVVIVSVTDVEVEAAGSEIPPGIEADAVLRPRRRLLRSPFVLQLRPLSDMVGIHPGPNIAGRREGGVKIESALSRIATAEHQVERPLVPVLRGTYRHRSDGFRIEYRFPRRRGDGVTYIRFQRDRIGHAGRKIEFLRLAEFRYVLPRHLDTLRNGGGILLCRQHPCGQKGRDNSHNYPLHLPLGLYLSTIRGRRPCITANRQRTAPYAFCAFVRIRRPGRRPPYNAAIRAFASSTTPSVALG